MVEGDRVAWVGPAADAPAADATVDAGGRAVLPGFVDCHSHLVFAGDRAAEFAARMAGEAYAAGGIRTTVAATRAATDEQLAGARRPAGRRDAAPGHHDRRDQERLRPHRPRRGAQSLAVARQFTDETTFLGAHVVPADSDPGEYVALVTGPMLAAATPYARWIDVFCETGAFDADQARAVLLAGEAAGLRGRLHANQLGPGPGVQLACELGLVAVDHCTYLTDADVDCAPRLRHHRDPAARRGVLHAPALPRRPPAARRRRVRGARLATATPGSCFTSSMPLCIALAVREMGMTPAEAVCAPPPPAAPRPSTATTSACSPSGQRADLVLLDAPTHVHLAYRPGVPLVAGVWSAGRPVLGGS